MYMCCTSLEGIYFSVLESFLLLYSFPFKRVKFLPLIWKSFFLLLDEMHWNRAFEKLKRIRGTPNAHEKTKIPGECVIQNAMRVQTAGEVLWRWEDLFFSARKRINRIRFLGVVINDKETSIFLLARSMFSSTSSIWFLRPRKWIM